LDALSFQAKDAAQARQLLTIAAVLDGASREDAAKIDGMDRQTLRDWVIRFNEQGPNGLINIPSPGAPPKLGKKHRAFRLHSESSGLNWLRWFHCQVDSAFSTGRRRQWTENSGRAIEQNYRSSDDGVRPASHGFLTLTSNPAARVGKSSQAGSTSCPRNRAH